MSSSQAASWVTDNGNWSEKESQSVIDRFCCLCVIFPRNIYLSKKEKKEGGGSCSCLCSVSWLEAQGGSPHGPAAARHVVSPRSDVATVLPTFLLFPHSFPGLQCSALQGYCTYQKCRVKLSRNGDRLFLAGGPWARNILPEEIWSIFMESRIRLSMGLMFISHLRPFWKSHQ